MAASGENHAAENKEIILSLCAGSSLVKGQILFSSDSKFVFCCSGSVVKVFNTTNVQCTQLLRGHRETVTGLALNPTNRLQLLSCAVDGSVNQWDYSDGVLLKTYSFYMPLHGLLSFDSSAGYITAIAHRPQGTHCCVVRLSLKKDKKAKGGKPEKNQEEGSAALVKTDVLIPSCQADHRTVSQGYHGEFLASVHGHELSVYSCKKRTCKKFTTDKADPFTCVACHPTQSCLATGHVSGKITVWWDFYNKDKTTMSSSHWHSLPVQALAFSPEGSYLLSGGHECVLVKWRTNLEHKDFLPRLGAPLHSITSSPDGTLYVTGHNDNVLQLITSNFHIIHAIRGLARAHLGSEKGSDPTPVGLLCDPRSKALVTNGRPGHLQFYCMSTDTQLYNLDIVGQNYISPDDLKKPLAVTEVEQAAFDRRGEWLVTFERWDDGQMTPEYRIKFWSFNREQKNYQLNTTVERPHNKPVGCLQFRPRLTPRSSQPPTTVSTSADGYFKLWTLETKTHGNQQVQQWTCDSVGYYRDKPAGRARFSEDGSVLAVAFQKTLTLWETEDIVMKGTLSLPTSNEDIRFVEFGGKTCSHLVVTTTSTELTVWNLISLSVHLKVSLNVAVLSTDGDLMSVVTDDRDLYVFRPNKWQPLFQKEKAVKHPVASAIFLPQSNQSGMTPDSGALRWQQQSRLHLLDAKQQLFTPEYLSDVISTNKHSSRTRVELQQTLPQTPFSTLLTSSRRKDEAADTTSRPPGTPWHRGSTSTVFDVMNTSVATMEPFNKIIGQFIEISLLKHKGGKNILEKGDDEDEDDSMATEDDFMATDSS